MRWLVILLVISFEVHLLLSSTSALQEHSNTKKAEDDGIHITAVSKRGFSGGSRGGGGGFRGGGGSSRGSSGGGISSSGGGAKGSAGTPGGLRIGGTTPVYGGAATGAVIGTAVGGGSRHRNNTTNHYSASPAGPSPLAPSFFLLLLGILFS